MSAPTPAPGDDRPREGYYPDPSIPGYVRYWNGASWVPGTSRPAPQDGESLAPPPGAGAGQSGAAASVEETGPHFFDEDPVEEPSGSPSAADAQHGSRPEPASAWGADRSRQSGFGGDQDRRVSWGAPQGAQGAGPQGAPGGDPRVARADQRPEGEPARTDGTASTPPAGQEANAAAGGGTFVFRRPAGQAGGGAAADAPDDGTMTFRAVSPRTGPAGGGSKPAGGQGGPGRGPAGSGVNSAGPGGNSGGPGGNAGGAGFGPAGPGSGSAASGFVGAQGVQGVQGAQGVQGLPGAQGGAVGAGFGPAGPGGDPAASPFGGQGGAAGSGAGSGAASGAGFGPAGPGSGAAASAYGPGPSGPAFGPQAGPTGSGSGSAGPGFGAGKAAAARASAAQAGAGSAAAQASGAAPSALSGPQAAPTVPPQSAGPGSAQPGAAASSGTPLSAGPGGGQSSWAQQVHRLAGGGGGDEQPVAPWKPPVEDVFQAAARRQAEARPAGLGKRLAARLLDTVVLAALTAAAAVPLGTKAIDHVNEKIDAAKLSGETVTVWLLDGTTSVYLGIILAVLLLAGVLCEVLPTAKWGRTLGKKLMGLEVRDIEAHDTPEFGAALRRWLVYSVPGLLVVGIVGVAWCLFDRPWRQCWHDKAAHTFVAG
ncbi:RDD family protein [Streptomyces sp. NRRL S-475]|uniref:RDD family protein n=1 Tax=Streptomyces sp. NRRL S-475 TaxID=1463910 RepID=UPI00068FBC7A|nr:RDD family protein [Streptomyces sp. NRRL S-475]